MRVFVLKSTEPLEQLEQIEGQLAHSRETA
jgi:hypothetical protein